MPADPGYPRAGDNFADLLRGYRRSRGLTQVEFAVRAGVGVRTVRDLERGRARPQRATIDLLAGALGLAGEHRSEFAALGRRAVPPAGTPAGDALVGPGAAGRRPGTRATTPPRLPPSPRLIGRDRDLAELDRLVAVAGTVTLVGPAGVGKTSLGWALADRAAGRHTGGTVAIAVRDTSTEPDLLAAIAAAFGVPRIPALPARLAGRPALLLVDGVDRAPHAARDALRRLLDEVSGLHVIATGRQGTGLKGEYVRSVAPLAVPPADRLGMDRTVRYPAVMLFLTRLRQARGGRGPSAAESAAVGPLVRRLGGVPLALELSAYRGRVLAVDEILRRLADPATALADPEPDLADPEPDRVVPEPDLAVPGPDLVAAEPDLAAAEPHRVAAEPDRVAAEPDRQVREAVAATYRLLEPAGRYALRLLAAFHGRWSLELAGMLIGEVPGDLAVLLDLLVSLGMVRVCGTGEMRFVLPDPVRGYAAERCARAGESPAARAEHTRVITGYVAGIAPGLVGTGMPAAVARLDEVASDLSAALAAAAADDPVAALLLASRLPRWWRFRGRDRLGRRWLGALLRDPRTAGAPPAVRAWAQVGVARLAAEHGDGLAELAGVEAALATFAGLGDVDGQLAARTLLCVLLQASGGHEPARRHCEAVLALANRCGRTRDVIVAQNNLAWHDIRVADLGAAGRRLATVQRLARDLGDRRLGAVAQANLAEVARLDGRYPDAVGTGRHAAALLAEVGDPGQHRRALATVALALAQHSPAEAAVSIIELRRHPGAAGVLALTEGYLALAAGDRRGAARRFGAAADVLAGRHDVRDEVEALVGLVVSLRGQVQSLARERLAAVCRRAGVTLLPLERGRLAAAGGC